jgi:Flp pilus assembly CpaE family ATPase
MGFFSWIKKALESKETKREKQKKHIKEILTEKQKLPKKESFKYKETTKKISDKYHHVVKIYFVRDNMNLDDEIIELMIKFIKKYKDRYLAKNEDGKINDYAEEPELKTMFYNEFQQELYIEIIILASERKRLLIKELWQFAQEFLDQKTKEGSAKARLVGLTKLGLVKNDIDY